MSSRTATRAAMRALKASRPAVQQRTFLSAAFNATRQTASKQMPKATFAAQQVRGIKTVDFAGHKEQVFGAFMRFHDFYEFWEAHGAVKGLPPILQRADEMVL